MARKRTNTDSTRAVLYLRVSTQEQARDDAHGLQLQEAAARAVCAARGLRVVAVHSDIGISGTVPVAQRAGLQAAMAACGNGGAGWLVVYAQDRLARSSGVFDAIRAAAQAGGYRLLSATDGRVLTDAEDELSGDAMAFVASIERKLIARRLSAGRAARGAVDGAGSGKLPFGYTWHGTEIVAEPEQAQAVAELLALHSTGASLAQIAAHLNTLGYTAPAGGAWTRSSVQGVLRNATTYRTGVRFWNDTAAQVRYPVLAR